MSDAGNDISIFPIETRIQSVRAESCVVKDPVAVFGPQVKEGLRLSLGDVVGGQPGGGDTDQLPRVTTAPTLPGVRVVAVEDVSVPDLDVGVPKVSPGVLGLEHGWGDAADAARPGRGDHDGGGAEIDAAPESGVKRSRALIQQRLKKWEIEINWM